MTKETEFLLAQWALWSRIDAGIAKGYPTHSPHEKPGTRDDLAITDEEGMLLDKAVTKLVNRDKKIGNATRLYYFYQQNLSRTAEKLETSRGTVRLWVTAGTAWIDGVLLG